MKQSGQVVLLPFPFTDLSAAKLRPALILRKASREFDDWLVCMVSSQLHQMDEEMDEIVNASDADYKSSGLKAPSVLRLSRLAVVDGALLVGSIGSISDGRLTRVRERLASWIRLEWSRWLSAQFCSLFFLILACPVFLLLRHLALW